MISFSVIKPKIISVGHSSLTTINLFVNLNMTADSGYYTNKIYAFRQAPKKIRGPGVGFSALGKISLGGNVTLLMVAARLDTIRSLVLWV